MVNFKEKNTTINDHYYLILLHKLVDSVTEKRRAKLIEGVLLIYCKALVQTTRVALATIKDCDFTHYTVLIRLQIYFYSFYNPTTLRGSGFNNK